MLGAYTMGNPSPSHAGPLFQLASTLEACVEQTWTILGRAVHDRKHGFHLVTLITNTAAGEPDGRVVVLRKVLRETATFLAHTDVRSDKARMLMAQPKQTAPCALVFYDAGIRLQLRVRGQLSLHSDGQLAATQWAASTLSSRRCYLAPNAPGSEQPGPDANLPEAMLDRTPSSKEAEPGRANFGVLACRATAMEVLHLGARGHTRCAWEIDNAGSVTKMRWLSP